MESITGSLDRRYSTHTMMYYKPLSEIGCSQGGHALSRRDGSEEKGRKKGLSFCAERCLQHEGAWDIEKGWHKGIRRDVRGKNGSGPAACRELVDSQRSTAGKGRHLKRSETGVIGSSKTVAPLYYERGSEVRRRIGTDLMTQDEQVVNNKGDRLWGLDLEREFADRQYCSQPVKYMRGWHNSWRSWIACEGETDDPSFSIFQEYRFLDQEGGSP
jgi:hypothetical protein